ncbi:ABC-2 type transport system ATP-binding protein [Peptoclostridium litorale DSM 5388]|uniref:ABC-type multidrug transport system, ATPase component n=1 Tax=Peptoclostridium litorale DSM 5388 TaxID=1121324 RepID=A0A069RNE3_PEPLI|nr:ABC transporter ATP-binding protein [Peptoclostridium litorale]KDR95697.1 ABC-type multidrug transport system, ATPase component [Peptoclostridium litorale DSM 5388]SIO01338.1 ABC-2 type transport system ATP-binding protein [Peptoclostridium litorale DSM 5388]
MENSKIAAWAKGLTKHFGEIVAVDNVDIQIPKGFIYGILGPNGAGKSTLIRMLCGVLTPTSGDGGIFGYRISSEPEKIKENIGYMSQKFSLYEDLTVLENINFYAQIYGVNKDIKAERIRQIVKMAGLEGRETQLARNLSGGWKQRLSLGCTLLHKPKMLILDEPTAGVDPVSRRIFWQIIYGLSKEGITIIVTTHYMDEAESCDEVIFVFRGRIIGKGTPKDLILEKDARNLEDVFISYVEEDTGHKVESSFEEIKFMFHERKGDEDEI